MPEGAVTIADGPLQVRLHPDFPQVVDYRLGGEQLAGRIGEAGALAVRLAAHTPMPMPRYVDIAAGPGELATLRAADPPSEEPGGARRVVRRCSCCLIYQARGEGKCVSCPRRRPDDRARALGEWLARQ